MIPIAQILSSPAFTDTPPPATPSNQSVACRVAGGVAGSVVKIVTQPEDTEDA